ncbi:MAG: FecR domain-containing protein [Sphingobacteriaceae bacterium]|nr:FecR domain-containing protein [Cytophagaceae bacterium]
MNYQHDRREEFVADSAFRRWVQQPDDASEAFWAAFLLEHPGQTETIRQAAEVVRQLALATAPMVSTTASEEQKALWQAIRQRVKAEPEATETNSAPVRRLWGWTAAAASVALLLGFGWWGLQANLTPETGDPYSRLVAQAEVSLVEKVNSGEGPLTVTLPDGSSVILQKRSRLSYPRTFPAQKREVYLTGEAFFEVAKNPQQPFFVYANELTTKVLGTSFNVKAYPTDRDVVVRVRTGKVSVFAQSDPALTEKATSRELTGIVLTPNQQVVFARDEVRLTKSLVTEPAVLKSAPAARFVFNAAPVSEVFAALERAYGIDVVFDDESLAACQLTADLSDEPLFEKLTIICQSIEARYEVLDAQVVVSGKGCGK